MPHLHFLGTTSMLAGDDIRQPLVLAMTFRCFEIMFSIVLMVYVIGNPDVEQRFEIVVEECINYYVDVSGSGGGTGGESSSSTTVRRTRALQNVFNLTVGYIILSFVISTIGLCEYVTMFILAEKGTPSDPYPRRHLGPLCTINLTLTYYVRVATFIFGMVMSGIYSQYCNCHADYVNYYTTTDPNDNNDNGRRFLSFEDVDSLRETCWMYKSWFSTAMYGLFICQAIDTAYGIIYYVILLCYTIPNKPSSLVHANTRWNVCCRCCIGCLTCATCCSVGGLEAIESGELQHFASLATKFFDGGGILDVTPTDILAGLYITRLLHYLEEYDIRQRLNNDNQKQDDRMEDTNCQQELAGGVANYDNHKLNDSARLSTNQERSTPGSVRNEQSSKVTSINDESKESEKSSEKDCTTGDHKHHHHHNHPVIQLHESNVSYTCDDNGTPFGSLTTQQPNRRITKPSRVSVFIQKAGTSNNDPTPPPSSTTTSTTNRGQQQAVELAEEEEQTFIPTINNNKRLSPNNPNDRQVIAIGARFIHFAEAIYTWSVHDRTRWWQEGPLVDTLLTAEDHHSSGDKTGRAIIYAPIIGIAEDDIVYANYNTGVIATPFAVVVDRYWKTIVVTIRGSATIDDMMTDLTLGHTELTSCGTKFGFDGTGRYAHDGILASAQWITDDLIKNGILERLMLDESSLYKTFNLRIVGHSLGATASVLVAMMLRPIFPSVQAVAYEPPGCSVSFNLAVESEQWALSFVTGLDVIPRFKYQSMANMRDEVLINISRIKVAKYLIHRNREIHERKDISSVRGFLTSSLYDLENIPKTKFFEQICQFRKYHRDKMDKMLQKTDGGLFLPGRIVQLMNSTGSVYDNNVRSTITNQPDCDDVGALSYWADREDYSTVVLSPHLISDHTTAVIISEFESLRDYFDVPSPLVMPSPEDEARH